MQNIPVNLGGYTLMVTESPEVKTREAEDGTTEVVVDRVTNAQMFVVSLFAKQRATDGRKFKGEEIKVTLEADPGELAEGTYVELVDPRISPWQTERGGRTFSGISFRAAGVTPRS